MLTSLDQLFEHYNVPAKNRNRMLSVCKSKQTDDISLIQYFGKDKMLKLNIEEWWQDHRFIPYGNDIYGVYSAKGYQLFDDNYTLNTTFEGDRSELGIPIMIVKFNKEEYNRKKEEYHKFWEWRKNRNPKRLAMEEEFNFDGKFAMHLVRLLRMGIEALRDGEIIVKRPDAEELLSIRNGSWTYDQIVQYAEKMDNEVRNIWYKKTQLPKKPDIKFAAELLMSVQDIVWKNNI